MKYKKYDVITLNDSKKLVVLETLEYNGNMYLYVDEVTDDESNTLGNYQIFRVGEGNIIQKETNPDLLISILPLFSQNIKLNNE